MQARFSNLTRLILALAALTFAMPVALGQGRIPNFPPGIALPDDTGRHGVVWLGGDSPIGASLGPDLSFWAFGDTFIGDPAAPSRRLDRVVANTIAIGQTQSGTFVPRYFYRGTFDARQAFFPDPDPSHKYWPKAVLVLRGKLYVFLSLIYVNLNKGADDPLGVLDTGCVVARVNNPTEMPTRWSVDYITLHVERRPSQARLKPVVEVIPADGGRSLIVYGFFNDEPSNTNRSVVLLVASDALENAPTGTDVDPSRVQYLSAGPGNANPTWKPGFGRWETGPGDYFDTRIDSVSGFTVRWNSILAKWQVVGADSQFAAASPWPRGNPFHPKPTARIFLHPTPFGPFAGTPESITQEFFTFPELRNPPDESIYCYCAHQWQDPTEPTLSSDANLLLTYTYSSRDFNRLLADPATYQNKSVFLQNPYSGAQANPDVARTPMPPLNVRTIPDPFAAPGAPKPLPFPPR